MKAHLLVSCAHVDLFEPVELVENVQIATAIQIFNHFLPIKYINVEFYFKWVIFEK